MIAQSVRGVRVIPAESFFTGIMSTTLTDDELLVEVQIPLLEPDTRYGFYEFNRRAGDFAIAMALTVYRNNRSYISDARIGIGGAESHPRRILEAELALNGRIPNAQIFSDAAERAALSVDPIEDAINSAEYRRDLVRTVTQRALDRSVR
jgi:aerobic carbon-monoxide dehydrogenase medium subunit